MSASGGEAVAVTVERQRIGDVVAWGTAHVHFADAAARARWSDLRANEAAANEMVRRLRERRERSAPGDHGLA